MKRCNGYAYIEILLAVALLAFSLAPMLESLANGFRHQDIQADYEQALSQVQARMQTLHTLSYADLSSEAIAVGDESVATAYSDAASASPRVLVYLALYDHDNADADNDPFTGGDAGLVWIRVASESGDVDYQTMRADL